MKEEIMNDAIDDAMENEDDEEERYITEIIFTDINHLSGCVLLIYRLFSVSDAVVSQVLDELGLQLTDQLSGLPQASGSLSIAGSKQPMATPAGADDGGNLADADADLQARLENLRRE